MLEQKRLFLVMPKRLGDSIFYTPVLAFIKKHYPSCQIDVMVLSKPSEQVLRHNPSIRTVYWHEDIKYSYINTHYDYLLKLYDHRKTIHDILNHITLPRLEFKTDGKQVAADYYLQQLSLQLGKPVEVADRHYFVYPQAHDIAECRKKLSAQGVWPSDQLIIMHLGCHGIAKISWWKFWKKASHRRIWPLSYFINLAEQIQKNYPFTKFVLTGTHTEKSLAKRFCQKIKSSVNLVSQTNVLQSAALTRCVKLVITCDTGLLHLACSQDAPVVALFNDHNIERTGPYPKAPHNKIVHAKEIKDISVESVLNAVKQQLDGTKSTLAPHAALETVA